MTLQDIKLYKFLCLKAKEGSLVTYGEVADYMGLDLNDPYDHYTILPNLMGNINRDLIANKEPLITALIILKTKPQEPSKGFYNFAKEMNLIPKGMKNYPFWVQEVSKVFNHNWDLNKVI